jgi:hypothetical protein
MNANDEVLFVVEAFVAKSALVVAPVKVPFVAKRLVVLMLVLVLLVIVALVPVSDVKNPLVAVRIDAKKLVLVAAVVVLRRMFAKMFAPEKVLASERSVDDAAVLPMQTPRILKQPLVSWIPLAKVEVAEPVTARFVVVAPVNEAFWAKRLVAVALVMVAEGANSPPIAERSPEK